MSSLLTHHSPLALPVCVCSLFFSVGNFLDMWKVSWEGPRSDLPCDQHRRWSLLSACLETQERERWAGLAAWPGRLKPAEQKPLPQSTCGEMAGPCWCLVFSSIHLPRPYCRTVRDLEGFFLFQDQTEIGLYGWRFARIREKLESAWVQGTPGYFTRGIRRPVSHFPRHACWCYLFGDICPCASLESHVHS